jgi:hypothetical protein
MSEQLAGERHARFAAHWEFPHLDKIVLKVLPLMRIITELVGVYGEGLGQGKLSRDPFRERWLTYRKIWEITRMLDDTPGWECSTQLRWV